MFLWPLIPLSFNRKLLRNGAFVVFFAKSAADGVLARFPLGKQFVVCVFGVSLARHGFTKC